MKKNIKENYSNHTLIEAKLETGRTHQIRVHLAYQKFPLLGDPLYSQRTFLPKKADPDNPLHQGPLDIIKNFSRQALCAYALEFSHPITGEILSFKIQIPEDFKAVLNSLDYFESRGINNPK